MNNLTTFLTTYINEVVNLDPYNEGNQYSFKSGEFNYKLYIKLEDIGGVAKVSTLDNKEEYLYLLKKENDLWKIDSPVTWRYLDDITYAFYHLDKHEN